MEIHSPVSFISYYLQHILLAINPQGTVFLAGTLAVLLILSFTISGAEVALFSLSLKHVNMLKKLKHTQARRILTLLQQPKEVYASLLIAGTIINICIIIFADFLIQQYVPYNTLKLFTQPFNYIVEFLLRASLIGLVLIFLVKIFPKVYAAQNNVRFAYGSSFIVEAIHLLFNKISKWVVALADGIGKQAGADKSDAVSMQELDEAIDIKTDDEASPEEKSIMKGIVKFGDMTVKQIMRSRLDVSGVEYNSSFTALVKCVEELHYSRLPVYKKSLDDVAGIINTKDIIPHLDDTDSFDWHVLMRQPFFVPEQKPIEDLLKEFQQKRIHFAVVVDEFGGTSGIVTMEDILEEVIGDIKDEFDEEESGNRRVDENTYIFEGRTGIHDACKMMRIPADTFDEIKGESESIGGLLLEMAGEFPAADTVLSSGDFEFTVLQTDNNRIQQVKVIIKPREGNKK